MSSELKNQEISAEVAEELLLNLNRSANYQRLRETFKSKSLFEIASKQRDEGTHSNYIQWLLRDSDVPCDWRDSTIAHLLDIILFRAREQGLDIDSEIKRTILSRSGKITLLSVEREKTTSGVIFKGQTGRIDLLIRCNVACPDGDKIVEICIENKVDSDEHDDQTWKYWWYLKGEKGLDECKKSVENVEFSSKYDRAEVDQLSEGESKPKVEQLFVFLTPLSNLELQDRLENDDKKKKLCSCHDYIIINYQDIMDYILEPILKMPNLPEKTKFYIEEYINTLCIPYREEDNKNNKFSIMAIDDNTRALLSEFWTEHKGLIKSAVKVIANDDKQDPQAREEAENVLFAMNMKPLKYKIVKWDDNSEVDNKPYDTRGVVIKTVEHLLEKGHEVKEINNKIGKNIVILSNPPTRPTDWTMVEINNETYYVLNQWVSTNPKDSRYVGNFIDRVKKHYKIEIEPII